MTRSQWSGMMSWPISPEWKCEICGAELFFVAGLLITVPLVWGLVNGVCRCETCHALYTMREGATPICLVKEEYHEPAVEGWKRFSRPIDTFTESEWKELGV